MSTVGTMLRLARHLRKLQQGEAAAALGVPNAELSRVENGLKEASSALLDGAARLYSVPPSFFAQSDTVFGAPVSVQPMWRKRSDVAAPDMHRMVAELNIRTMHIRRLLEATDVEPARRLPQLDADAYGNDGEAIAGLLRRFWQVPSGPIADLTALVEEAGIIVAHSDFDGAPVSGVTFSVPGVPPLVLLNSTQSADRMRFTLAHELGHIVMHRFPTPDMEDEADAFASCFLVPTDDARPYFVGRRVDIRLLAALKPEWRASMASLVFVAKRVGALSEAQAAYLWKQFNIAKIKMREPPELDFPAEKPATLGDLLSLHMQELGYSIGDLSEVMCLNADEVSRTYSIALPSEEKSRPAHLRVVR